MASNCLLLKQNREQFKLVSSNAKDESETLGQMIKSKNEEIDKLNLKLNTAKDEIIQLKEQMVSTSSSFLRMSFLLVGTPLVEGRIIIMSLFTHPLKSKYSQQRILKDECHMISIGSLQLLINFSLTLCSL